MKTQTTAPRSMLRLPAVLAVTGLSKSQIYRRMDGGTFPLSVEVGPNASAWFAAVDVAQAGGWSSLDALKVAYQRPDSETVLRVVTHGAELRKVR